METLGCICCGGVYPQVDCPRRLWTSPNLHMESLLVNRPAQDGNPHATRMLSACQFGVRQHAPDATSTVVGRSSLPVGGSQNTKLMRECPPHSPRRVARARGSFRSQRCYQVAEQWEEHTRTSWFLPELDTTDQNRQSDTRRGDRRR